MSELRIYRRRLPHWRIDGSTYFATWCLERGARELDGAERDTILAAVLHFNGLRYLLHACVVMNDHVHVLVEPSEPFQLEELIHSWKSFTANQLQKSGRSGRIWQPEYWDRLLRGDREFDETLTYLANNPFSRWGIESYPWLWIDPEVLT